jgi:hypothetical protein
MSMFPSTCNKSGCAAEKQRLRENGRIATSVNELLANRLERARDIVQRALAQRSCECLPNSGCTKAAVYAEMSKLLTELT